MPVKTGFEHSVFDVAYFDELPETTDFEDNVKAVTNLPKIRFVFKATVYDSRVLAAPTISRDAEITAGSVSIELSNTDGFWNLFITDRTNIGARCAIGLYFAPVTAIGLLYIFTGTVEGVTYTDASVVLTIRDKMAPMLQKRIGHGRTPVDFYSSAYAPEQIVWPLLTDDDFGGLSDEMSAANPDIDYVSLLAWASDCAGKSYDLQGRFTGQTIRSILTDIAKLTNSLIWVNGMGRFEFKMFDPPETGDETLTRSNCTVIDLDINRDVIYNYIIVYHGYDPISDTWDNFVSDYDGVSTVRHGRRTYTEEGKVIWHSGTTSAGNFLDDYLLFWADPQERILVTATMIGVLCDLGTPIYITETLKDFTDRPYWVDKIVSLDIETGLVQLEGRYAG